MFSSEQYRALHETSGVIERSHRGRLLLTGEDRRSYLQGLLTNDIGALQPGTGCYAALLQPNGRMIADMRVFELGDSVLLDLDGGVAEAVRDRLEQFVIMEDVQVQDVTASRTELGIYGPGSADVLSRAVSARSAGPAPGGPRSVFESMPLFGNSRWMFDEGDAIVVRSDEIGVEGFDVFIERGVGERLRQQILDAGAVPIDAATAEACRVEAGRPLFSVDMDESTIPLEAGIEDRAISLTKGCYVGQEIIIRVLHRGHGRVARRLVGLLLDPADPVPVRSDRIRAQDRDVGWVTSAVMSPALGRPICLAYLQRDFTEPSTAVEVLTAGGGRAAVVSTLPFVTASLPADR